MNLDDESLLSAYLDDELDARRRVEVEAALRTDPHLTRRLGDLTASRDLVAGLGRPAAPGDLAAAILARLPDPPRAPRLAPGLLRLPPLLAAGAAAAALAAGILIVVTATGPGDRVQVARHDGPRPSLPARAGTGEDVVKQGAIERKLAQVSPRLEVSTDAKLPQSAVPPVAAPPGATRMGGLGGGAGRPAASEPAGADLVLASKAKKATSPAPADEAGAGPLHDQLGQGYKAEVAAADADREAFAGLIDRPSVCRITVGVDVVDDKTAREVRDLVDQTPKLDVRCAEVTVSQEIAIDPDRPGKAVVYAVILTGSERDFLAGTLKEKYGNVREDQPARPVAAELAQVSRRGQIRLFQGQRVALLGKTPPRFQKSSVMAKKDGPDQFFAQDSVNLRNSPEPRRPEARGADQVAAAQDGLKAAPATATAPAPAAPAAGYSLQDLARSEPPFMARQDREAAGKPRSRAVPAPPPPAQDSPALVARVMPGQTGSPPGTPLPDPPMTVLVWLTARDPDPKAAP